jgi:hypothetical protein
MAQWNRDEDSSLLNNKQLLGGTMTYGVSKSFVMGMVHSQVLSRLLGVNLSVMHPVCIMPT